MRITPKIAALAAAAVLVPAGAAGAHGPDGHVKPGAEHVAKDKGKGKAKVKSVTYVFKGVFNADGTVRVAKGNAHVKKAGLYGKDVAFTWTSAKLVVADADANGVSIADVKAGDKVLVQARAPRKLPASHTFTARKLVDQTHPPVEAPAATPAPAVTP